MVNTFLFVVPFVSGIMLLVNSNYVPVLSGLAIIIVTIIVLSMLAKPEQLIFIKFNLKTLSYITPIYYFVLVIISISLSWKYVNLNDVGNLWVFLYAFACCYIPYTYIMQGEQSKSGRIGILTNTINNYSIFGYLLFGILMNFTEVQIYWAYVAILLLGLLMLNGLPNRIKCEQFEGTLK